MSSKIGHFSELESVLGNFDSTSQGVQQYLKSFNVGALLAKCDIVKAKGFCVSYLLGALILFRLKGDSVNQMQGKWLQVMRKVDDNTFYRILNHPLINWRKLLMSFAKQFLDLVKSNGSSNNEPTCFVIDDSDLEKTGKTIEFVSRIYNHVTKTYPLGFKFLLLSFWDGKSLVSVDFSLHREKGSKNNYGLTPKELRNQFSKERDSKSPQYQRTKEVDLSKLEVIVMMLKRAVKNGFHAKYVLMDSWFVNDFIIKEIRAIKSGMMHVIGMCKMDKRNYLIDSKELNSNQIIAIKERKYKKYSRKFKSHYISMVADYKGQKVLLLYVKYHNARNWKLLLTTDLKLSFVQAMELYQIRWTIEVLFKECKQYLKLGRGQSTDFNGQIADITISLITHTILSLQKRFSAYETMGNLFRESQKDLLELTLWERLIKLLYTVLDEICDLFEIDADTIIEKIMQNDKSSQKLQLIFKSIEEYANNVKKAA